METEHRAAVYAARNDIAFYGASWGGADTDVRDGGHAVEQSDERARMGWPHSNRLVPASTPFSKVVIQGEDASAPGAQLGEPADPTPRLPLSSAQFESFEPVS